MDVKELIAKLERMGYSVWYTGDELMVDLKTKGGYLVRHTITALEVETADFPLDEFLVSQINKIIIENS